MSLLVLLVPGPAARMVATQVDASVEARAFPVELVVADWGVRLDAPAVVTFNAAAPVATLYVPEG